MKIFSNIVWILAALCMLYGVYTSYIMLAAANGAIQEIDGLVFGLFFVVVAYCFARAVTSIN